MACKHIVKYVPMYFHLFIGQYDSIKYQQMFIVYDNVNDWYWWFHSHWASMSQSPHMIYIMQHLWEIKKKLYKNKPILFL